MHCLWGHCPSLGGHLALSIKEKIWRGEFADLFSLLHKDPKAALKGGDPAPDPHVVRKRKIGKNWNNWLNGFIIYAAVVILMQPAKAATLFKYLDKIHGAFRKYEGTAWLTYDEHFHLHASHDPALDC